MPKPKKQRGRPPVKPMPERIDASPEEIVRAMFKVPADHRWRYMDETEPAGNKAPVNPGP